VTAFFVTGASGFVGRHLLRALGAAGASQVLCLTRNPRGLSALEAWNEGWECISGDLLDPASYAARIPAGGCVVHLAAAVGKRPERDYVRVNVDGTRTLLETAAAAGAAHFVFASTIATTYPDLAQYPYARSKRDAEDLVRAGNLPYTVLRPTIVLGAGSYTLAALQRMALRPRPIVPGTGRVEVQPVSVDDVARVLVRAAVDRWPGETIDVGGPEVVSMERLLALIREAHELPPRAPIHIPLRAIRQFLALIEPLLGSMLPVTAGQLAAFAYSSRAAESPRMSALVPGLTPLRAMLAGAAADSRRDDAQPRASAETR
jgi:nucleoside-diphosphate-sugar epimerase